MRNSITREVNLESDFCLEHFWEKVNNSYANRDELINQINEIMKPTPFYLSNDVSNSIIELFKKAEKTILISVTSLCSDKLKDILEIFISDNERLSIYLLFPETDMEFPGIAEFIDKLKDKADLRASDKPISGNIFIIDYNDGGEGLICGFDESSNSNYNDTEWIYHLKDNYLEDVSTFLSRNIVNAKSVSWRSNSIINDYELIKRPCESILFNIGNDTSLTDHILKTNNAVKDYCCLISTYIEGSNILLDYFIDNSELSENPDSSILILRKENNLLYSHSHTKNIPPLLEKMGSYCNIQIFSTDIPLFNCYLYETDKLIKSGYLFLNSLFSNFCIGESLDLCILLSEETTEHLVKLSKCGLFRQWEFTTKKLLKDLCNNNHLYTNDKLLHIFDLKTSKRFHIRFNKDNFRPIPSLIHNQEISVDGAFFNDIDYDDVFNRVHRPEKVISIKGCLPRRIIYNIELVLPKLPKTAKLSVLYQEWSIVNHKIDITKKRLNNYRLNGETEKYINELLRVHRKYNNRISNKRQYKEINDVLNLLELEINKVLNKKTVLFSGLNIYDICPKEDLPDINMGMLFEDSNQRYFVVNKDLITDYNMKRAMVLSRDIYRSKLVASNSEILFEAKRLYTNKISKIKPVMKKSMGYIHYTDENSFYITESEKYTDVELFDSQIIKYKVDNKYGLIDIYWNNILLNEYDDIIHFYGNLFMVKVREGDNATYKKGLVNSKGDLIIRPVFEDILSTSSEKLIRVKLKGKWGLLNFKGKFVIEPIYDFLNDFDKGSIDASIILNYYYTKIFDNNKEDVVNRLFNDKIRIMNKGKSKVYTDTNEKNRVTVNKSDSERLPLKNVIKRLMRFNKNKSNLNLSKQAIESLSDIEELKIIPNLKSLNLSHNSIKNLEELKIMSHLLRSLNRIDLSYCELSNLLPLISIKSLKILNVNNNNILSIEPLKFMINIEEVNLENNFIIDISPLKHLEHLKEVTLYGNPIILDKSKLGNENRYTANLLKDKLKGLPYIVTIKDKHLEHFIKNKTGHNPTDIIFDYEVDNITKLDAYSKEISSISGIQYLKNIEYMDLRNNYIIDLSPLRDLYNLKYINIKNNLIHISNNELYKQNMKTLKLLKVRNVIIEN